MEWRLDLSYGSEHYHPIEMEIKVMPRDLARHQCNFPERMRFPDKMMFGTHVSRSTNPKRFLRHFERRTMKYRCRNDPSMISFLNMLIVLMNSTAWTNSMRYFVILQENLCRVMLILS